MTKRTASWQVEEPPDTRWRRFRDWLRVRTFWWWAGFLAVTVLTIASKVGRMHDATESVFAVLSSVLCVALFLAASEGLSASSRPRPVIRKRIENLSERAVWPVRILLTRSGKTVGFDDGLAWFRDGMLWFDGETTAFRLGVEDVVIGPVTMARRIWSLALAEQADYEVRFQPLRCRGRSGDELIERLYGWLTLKPVATNEVIIPPMETKPGLDAAPPLPPWLQKLLFGKPVDPTAASRSD